MKIYVSIAAAVVVCARFGAALPKELLGREQLKCHDVTCVGGSEGDESCRTSCGGIYDGANSICTPAPGTYYARQEMACSSVYCLPGTNGDGICANACGGHCDPRHYKCTNKPKKSPRPLDKGTPQGPPAFQCSAVTCLPGPAGDSSCKQACGGRCDPQHNKCVEDPGKRHIPPTLEDRQAFQCFAVTCIPGTAGDSSCKASCGGRCDPVHYKCTK